MVSGMTWGLRGERAASFFELGDFNASLLSWAIAKESPTPVGLEPTASEYL